LKPIPAVDQSLHVREELPDLGGEHLCVRGRFPGQRRIELQEVDHAADLEQLQVQLFLAAEEGRVQRQRGDRPLGGFAKAVDVQAAQLAQGANDRQKVFLQADDLHMSHPVGHASSSPPAGLAQDDSQNTVDHGREMGTRVRSQRTGLLPGLIDNPPRFLTGCFQNRVVLGPALPATALDSLRLDCDGLLPGLGDQRRCRLLRQADPALVVALRLQDVLQGVRGIVGQSPGIHHSAAPFAAGSGRGPLAFVAGEAAGNRCS